MIGMIADWTWLGRLRKLGWVACLAFFVLVGVVVNPSHSWACYYGYTWVWYPCDGLVEDLEAEAEEGQWAASYSQVATNTGDLVGYAQDLNDMIAEMLDLYQGGFDQTAQAWQLNAEETKKVLEGTSQAIIDSDKYVSQTKGNAKRQAAAMVPKLATGCVVATAAQKRNASGSAADSAAIGYMKTAQSQGTGAYGVVPDNSAPVASANQLCARTGGGSGGWSFIPNHGGMEKTLKCP